MKRPDLSIGMTLGRAAAELSIIVLGVLIALAAQSWWEHRLEDEDRARVVMLLRDDVVRLEAVLRDSTAALATADAIRDILENRRVENDSLFGLDLHRSLFTFGVTIGTRDGDDLLPVYADLKGSGRLYLLPDSIRVRMSGIELQLERVNAAVSDIVKFQQDRLDPVALEVGRRDPAIRPRLGQPTFLDPEELLATLQAPRYKNLLLFKEALIVGTLSILGEAADSLVALRQVIDRVESAR